MASPWPAGLIIRWLWPMEIDAVSRKQQQRVYQAMGLAYPEYNRPREFQLALQKYGKQCAAHVQHLTCCTDCPGKRVIAKTSYSRSAVAECRAMETAPHKLSWAAGVPVLQWQGSDGAPTYCVGPRATLSLLARQSIHQSQM